MHVVLYEVWDSCNGTKQWLMAVVVEVRACAGGNRKGCVARLFDRRCCCKESAFTGKPASDKG